MRNKIIAKYIGYPLQDITKGTNIIKTLKFLLDSQYWDEDKINDYRVQKLKKLIDYSANNVPYYEDLFGRIKLTSEDINHIEDIKKIPITTKKILRERQLDFVSKNYNNKHVKKGKTGGTTGSPVFIYKDIMNRSFSWASYYRWLEWMGLNYYDSVSTIWGAKSVLSYTKKDKFTDFITEFIQNKNNYNSFNLNDEKLLEIYKSIQSKKPKLLRGYLSSVIEMSKFIDRNNLEPFELQAISTTTETLLPDNRFFIEQVLKTPVYDQYGCGEVSAISYECANHNGLHINQEHVICEVLDDNDVPIINKSGRIIATDLDNYVMPFIRYENGDLATLTDDKCNCGINQPLMKSIEGRSIDTIVLRNGSKVHGVFFTDILFELNIMAPIISRFQVYQNEPGKIEFRVEVFNRLDNKIISKLQSSLSMFFDDVSIIETQSLPVSANGKFKYIINEIVNH